MIALQAVIGALVVFFGVRLAFTAVEGGEFPGSQEAMAERIQAAAKKAAAKKGDDALWERKTKPDMSLFGKVEEEAKEELEEEKRSDDEIKPPKELLSLDECHTTTLPYELVGVMLYDNLGSGLAAVRIGGTEEVRLIAPGSETYDDDSLVLLAAVGVGPGGKERLVFRRDGEYECMDYDYKAKAESGMRGPPIPFKKKEEEAPSKENKYQSRVRKEGDTTVVEQGMIDDAMANMADTLRQAKMRPHKQGGKMVGFKFQKIKNGSMLEALGFKQGDIITKINGMDLASPDKALEVYGRLRSSKEFFVEVIRGGKPQKLDFSLR
ncbi:MAG: hypothetical protein Kow0090_22530 [Myxococcota bacterium]